MTAPDKPLHERVADYLAQPISKAEFFNPRAYVDTLLREAAAELSRMRAALENAEKENAAMQHDITRLHNSLSSEVSWRIEAETALTELVAMRMPTENLTRHPYRHGFAVASNQCAGIAERALTAGSGNEL